MAEHFALPDIFFLIAAMNLGLCALGVCAAFTLGLYVMREKTVPARLLACLAFSQGLILASIGNVAVGTFLHYSWDQWALHLAAQGVIVAFNTFALLRFYQHFRGS